MSQVQCIPPYMESLQSWYMNPYYKVDDHPGSLGNQWELRREAYDAFPKQPAWMQQLSYSRFRAPTASKKQVVQTNDLGQKGATCTSSATIRTLLHHWFASACVRNKKIKNWFAQNLKG